MLPAYPWIRTIIATFFSLTSHAFSFEVIPKRSKTAFRLADLLLFQKNIEVIPTSGHRERASYSLKLPKMRGLNL